MKTLKQYQPSLMGLLAAAIFIGLFTISIGAFAARGGIPGKPDTSGGGGGSPDLGDIVILYRDADGLPIPTTATQVVDPESGRLVAAGLCQQPIGLPSDTCPLVCTEPCLVPVDPLTCGVVVGYETCPQEVDFGRTSVVRSPDSVLDQALEEATARLATAQCLSLDSAGRLVTTSKIGDEILSATVDSPLQNLAIYRQLLLNGYLGDAANPIVLPDPDILTSAARGFGAAADKTGEVTVDQIAYTNQIMGLLDVPTYLPKKCVEVREEVRGTIQLVEKCVLDFSSYQYDRGVNFTSLPTPPYIPADDPQEGWFEYLGLWAEASGTTPDLFYVVQGPTLHTVFGSDPGFLNGNVGGFTQAADDTREVIEFTHDRPLPYGYDTPVPLLCDVSEEPIYDVSISGDSGLQVPMRMVIGTEGREVSVTVANAGPDTATGVVTVVGVATNGTTVFSESVPFTIDAGKTFSRTWMFTIDFATTITWAATATPDCATCDLNPANNSVTETTVVTGKGGGSGGQGNNPNR